MLLESYPARKHIPEYAVYTCGMGLNYCINVAEISKMEGLTKFVLCIKAREERQKGTTTVD